MVMVKKLWAKLAVASLCSAADGGLAAVTSPLCACWECSVFLSLRVPVSWKK